jgi:hypothetical protein
MYLNSGGAGVVMRNITAGPAIAQTSSTQPWSSWGVPPPGADAGLRFFYELRKGYAGRFRSRHDVCREFG